MSRRKQLDRPEAVLINIPTSVMTKVRLALLDPFTQKVEYGSLSKLTTQLFQRWLDEQQRLHRNSSATPPQQDQSGA